MSSPPTPSPTVIVVVEDDAAVRESLRFSLESEGFEVMACETGEALTVLEIPAAPACLLIDHRLGDGLSGLDALRILRARGVALPAITITTAASADLRQQARELGAAVIEKPLLDDTLIHAIRTLVSSIAPSRQGAASPAASRDD
jgi:FixJ family two-component response regulator